MALRWLNIQIYEHIGVILFWGTWPPLSDGLKVSQPLLPKTALDGVFYPDNKDNRTPIESFLCVWIFLTRHLNLRHTYVLSIFCLNSLCTGYFFLFLRTEGHLKGHWMMKTKWHSFLSLFPSGTQVLEMYMNLYPSFPFQLHIRFSFMLMYSHFVSKRHLLTRKT